MNWLFALFHDPMLDTILKEVRKMAGELDALEAKVTAASGVIDSAIELMQGLHAKLDEAIASGDMSRVAAVNDQLDAKTTALAAAVAANPLP
jgi:predicted butyrate kinase (DUF1464 family)